MPAGQSSYVRLMPERRANIGPRYAVRLSDLRRWHMLTAVCSSCRHRTRMRLWQLTVGQPAHTWLADIEARLRCRRCGNRNDNQVLVTVSDED